MNSYVDVFVELDFAPDKIEQYPWFEETRYKNNPPARVLL